MKKFSIAIFITFLVIGFMCNTERESPLSSILSGEHSLRRLKVKNTNHSTLSGEFFIFMGGISGESKIETNVIFSWKDNEGNYIISKLPITKIRLHIDNSIKNPYIKFKWSLNYYCNISDMESIFEDNIIYALIYCSENDYPKNLNFNNF